MSFTYGRLSTTQRFNLGFQLTPWLEASFRYSRLPRFLGDGQPEFDRSFGLKIRLSDETEYFPQLALGIRDLVGTGVYSGEYLVASKLIGPVDITAGVGWGRFAQDGALPNPLAQIFPSFRTRDTSFGLGGTPSFGQFFHGPRVGVFGGAVWRTPIENLDIVLEYSSDRYSSEATTGTYTARSPVNVGFAYHFLDAFTFSAGWFYGSSYGATLSLEIDPTVSATEQRIAAELPPPFVRSTQEQMGALSTLVRDRPLTLNDAHTPNDAYAPWVRVPVETDVNSLVLAPAFMREMAGMRDLDVVGHTLLINAHLGRSSRVQCERYASVTSIVAPRIATIALSDLDDSAGRVTMCSVTRSAQRATTDIAEPSPVAVEDVPETPSLDPAAVRNKIRSDLAAQSIRTVALSIERSTAWLYFVNGRYQFETEAAGRAARVLMVDAPPDVEIFHIISTRDGLPLRDFRVARSALERVSLTYGTSSELPDAVMLDTPPMSNPVLDSALSDNYPKWHWDIGPGLTQNFFNPSLPVQFQLLAVLHSSLELLPGLGIELKADANIVNNYDLRLPSDSLLPHVRSDLNEYLRQGEYGVDKLDLVYRARLTPEIMFEGKIGYLESMYAGAGLQLLWRPEGSRISFGADIYKVWQRDFNRLAGLQQYSAVTGHVSVYYESPWYDLNFAAHGGRYLAKDYGVTLEITRRFSTGVEIGAFATLTNVPFAKFGEGSFDKGIIVHIPMEWALPFFSRSSYDLVLRSLTRDGGQRLEGDNSLYRETLPTSYGETFEHIDQITAP